MKKTYLGEFEEVVLTMVGVIGEGAYGNRIVEEVEKQLNRSVNLSAVHITLYRLEDKGLVSSDMGGVTSSRGGRRKRFFKITNPGLAMLKDLQEQRTKLWKLIPGMNSSAL
ncbi:MAG: PadR family transcriptional regulator [Roseivirga sp.]|nr:PadR family transcriptional regulator [Roseivirga sp.]